MRAHVTGCILAGLIFVASCQSKATTQELLAGNFVSSGQSAIDLLVPTENQQVATSNPKFSWSSRGVGLYTLQVSTDVTFSNIVLDKDVPTNYYTLVNSDLKGLTSLPTNTYYWRVKIAKIQNNLQSTAGSFFLIALPASGSGSAGILYVDAISSATTQTGSKSAPYKKIQTAIESADAARNGNRDITFDIYVAGGGSRTYTESITLRAGISVYGGYDLTTDWSRNIAAAATIITSPSATGIFCNSEISTTYTDTTVFDGFTLNVTANTAVFGADLEACSPKISNNTITAESTGNDVYGIYANTSGFAKIVSNTIIAKNTAGTPAINVIGSWARSGAALYMENNTVTATLAGGGSSAYGSHFSNSTNSIITKSNYTINGGAGNYGISATAASLTVSSTAIRNAPSSSARGMNFSNSSSVTLTSNLIWTPTPAGGHGIFLDSSSATCTNNVIRVSASSGNAEGIHLNSSSSGTYTNNTIGVSASTTASAFTMNISNTAVITNNIFFTDAGTTRYGTLEGATDDPSNYSNNLIFDTTSLYRDEGSVNLNTIGTLCTTLLGNGTTTCSGNITTAGSLAAAFTTGYTAPASLTLPSQLKTWTILAGGPADISGGANGWSAGDIGADAANAGP